MAPRKNVIKIQVIDEEELNESVGAPQKTKAAPKKAVKKAAAKKTSGKTDLRPQNNAVNKKTSPKTSPKQAVKQIVVPEKSVISEIDELDTISMPKKNISKKTAKKAVPKKEEKSYVEVAGDESIGKEIKIKEEKNFDDILEQKGKKFNDVIKESISNEQNETEEKIAMVKASTGSGRSIKLYRRIAYFFIALTIVLVLAVAYYSIVRIDIILIPEQERVSNNLIFDVTDKDKNGQQNSNTIIGVVRDIEVIEEKDYVPSGEDVIGEEVIGEVVIYNNYSKNQPLVASTRLLSGDGKLYRLDETVNVPSGGQVTAPIYADESSEDMVVGPTKFTIPGLWAGLQDKIFAESKEKTVYQKKIDRFVADDDFENAERDLKQQLLVKAKEQVNETYKDYSQILYKIDENTIESEIEAEVGEKIDSYSASMSAKVIVVAYNSQDSANLAKNKFITTLSSSKELISFEDDKVLYSLNSFDIDAGTAAVNAQFSGKVSLKNDSSIIELDKIIGLNNDQLNVYLSELDGIAGFEVRYRPSFIKRVPNLVDRINVEVKR